MKTIFKNYTWKKLQSKMATVDSLQFSCSRHVVAKYLNIFLCPEESTYIKDPDDTFYEEISKVYTYCNGKKKCVVFPASSRKDTRTFLTAHASMKNQRWKK